MVSSWIANQHMDPEKAAEKYVKSHMSAVNKWLGK
jgi:ABC-type proline/glycine betaine transport system substrate-binding protein